MESLQLVSTAQIFRETIRLLIQHPTHFHTISIFFFSPLPLSLFITRFLIYKLHYMPSSTIKLAALLFGKHGALLQTVSSSFFTILFCFPFLITFSLFGKAATIQAVGNIYNGVNLKRERLITSGAAHWLKLMHVFLWQYFIAISLLVIFFICFEFVQAISALCCIHKLENWLVLVVLSVPFCVGFADVMVVGNLAGVVAVIEGGTCGGFDCLVKAKGLVNGRKQTTLLMALLSNAGMRLVEALFEFKMVKGMSIWEGPILVSMYSFILVLETVMNVVFYYTCKTFIVGPMKI